MYSEDVSEIHTEVARDVRTRVSRDFRTDVPRDVCNEYPYRRLCGLPTEISRNVLTGISRNLRTEVSRDLGTIASGRDQNCSCSSTWRIFRCAQLSKHSGGDITLMKTTACSQRALHSNCTQYSECEHHISVVNVGASSNAGQSVPQIKSRHWIASCKQECRMCSTAA